MPVPMTAIDPELRAALTALPRAANGSLMDLSDIPALRAYLRATTEQTPTTAHSDPRIAIDTVAVPRSDGSTLDVVTFTPVHLDGPHPALLWFHAGGQVVGSAQEDTDYQAALALSLGCVVASVDYRLAPETPAPGAAEDGFLAYVHLCEHGAARGIDPCRIGIGGASGGGAIAAATALMVRDRGALRPCLLSLSYPMLDDRNETASTHRVTDVGIWDRRENLLAWTAVLGARSGSPDVHPYAAPGRVTDVSGLPPTFLAAAQHDVFRDENLDLARKLLEADIPTDLHVYGRAFHAWDRFAPEAALTREFEHTWHSFLRKHLRP